MSAPYLEKSIADLMAAIERLSGIQEQLDPDRRVDLRLVLDAAQAQATHQQRLIQDAEDARDFPQNTCPASRHVQMIGECLVTGRVSPILYDDPRHCGESLLSVVKSLWETRTQLESLQASTPSSAAGPGTV